MTESAIELRGLGKSFGAATALHETSLAVRRGEFMTLLGPSGCGKTTLLNLVSGFLEPDRGRIVIDGEDVTRLPAHRRGIGVVFQNYALFPHMSVGRNVGYGLRMRGLARPEIARRVDEALDLVKLADYADRKPHQLSGGQQQRVALARALVIRPKVLLLDEPFSALDKNLRGAMQIELKDIQRRLGVTTIFVTHDQSEALSLSDRIAVMAEGRIRQIGTPDAIYRTPRDPFVAAFVGDANVLAGTVEGDTILVGDCHVPSRSPLPDGAAVELYVRPENLAIAPDGQGLDGTVAALAYQGGHVDLYVDVAAARGGRAFLRLPSHATLGRYRVGDAVTLTVLPIDIVVFPAGESAL